MVKAVVGGWYDRLCLSMSATNHLVVFCGEKKKKDSYMFQYFLKYACHF